MRSISLATTAACVALLAGCSSASDDGPGPTARASSTATDACTEVVAGIDDFNLGDYDGTVVHFRKAIPLAEAQAQQDDSQEAANLLEAVRYYAELAPDEYPDAARSSRDFAKYKAITLGQCVPVEQPDGETEPPPVTT
jgi:hypothetical protein